MGVQYENANVVINNLGGIEQVLGFDPWGMRLNVGDQRAVNSVTNRGYTSHETDDETGLINMNARVYDPLIGRFMSADPVLPDAGNMQAFNRYSYVLNNPLVYTDPTGNVPFPAFTFEFGFLNSACQNCRDILRGLGTLLEFVINSGILTNGGTSPQTSDEEETPNPTIGFGPNTADEDEEEGMFVFTNEDGLQTLNFFFGALRDQTRNNAFRTLGRSTDVRTDVNEVIEVVNDIVMLTDSQLEFALDVASSLTAIFAPRAAVHTAVDFAVGAGVFGRALPSLGRAVLTANDIQSTLTTVNTLDGDFGMQIRNHLNTDFSAFRPSGLFGVFNDFFNGSTFTGPGIDAVTQTFRNIGLPGPNGSASIDDFLRSLGF